MTLIGRPDDRTNATASRLNSGDHRRRESPMMDELLPRPPSLCQVSAPAGDAHTVTEHMADDGKAVHPHERDRAQPVTTVPHVGGLPSADLDNPQNDETSGTRGGPCQRATITTHPQRSTRRARNLRAVLLADDGVWV